MNILDSNFKIVSTIDLYESFLWNIRFSSPGDFKLTVSPYTLINADVRMGYYVSRDDNDRIMIIETQYPNTDTDKGDTITIGGRSLESILFRRIIWRQTIISGNLQNGIKKLLNENAINPENTNRKIPNLIFEESIDPNVTSITIPETQFTGDNLGETIEKLCVQHNIGWKITLNQDNQMVFKLISGKKRNVNQNQYTQITFSVENDNLFYSKHSIDTTNYKNVTLIAGEGEGLERRTATFGDDNSGLDRYEVYTDARDISSSTDDGEINPEQYNNMLIERGKQNLENYIINEIVDAEVDTNETTMFEFREESIYANKSLFPEIGRLEKVYCDLSTNLIWEWTGYSYEQYFKGYYSLGDVVNVIDRYGYASSSRVIEMTICEDSDGIKAYPIFEYEPESEEQLND